MSKLSKAQAKQHREALALVAESKTRRLTVDERWQIIDSFHEGANHMNGAAGAFFTPHGLAQDFSLEVPRGKGRRIIDLCAGIGALSFHCEDRVFSRADESHFVCVERNPDYVDAGRAVMPDATWVCASVFDLAAYQHLGPFDCAISNPPFGAIPADGFEGAYTGKRFEYRVMEVASKVARYGAFILPQQSANFRYSGMPCFEYVESDLTRRFREQTGIVIEPGCGIDTAYYAKAWKGVSPICEIVCCNFEPQAVDSVVAPAEIPMGQQDLFARVA